MTAASDGARRGTPDQRRGIELAGQDVAVVAGAGTGKTFVLTERVVHRVTKGGPTGARVDLRDVLAITFTEKAAAEMKDRLAAALEKCGIPGARQAVETAAISTVHAFCARMLRENAVAAGVDPAFAVLDETEAGRLLDGALDALVDEWRERAPADFELLAMLGGDDPAETLAEVYRAAQSSGQAPGAFCRTVAGLPDVAAAVQPVRDAVRVLRGVSGQGTDAAQKRVAAALAASAALERLADGAAVAETLAAVSAVDDAVDLRCAEPAKSALLAVREACAAAMPVLTEHAAAPLRDVVARAVERIDELYHDAKGRGERLDFADLERSAVALLAARDDVLAAVRSRRPELLVDEFQDTNAVQARLVDLLRTPDRLFVVGDPKQSIYGFRGADVTVFEGHLAAVAAQGRAGVVTLRHSFRTRPEVLGAVNRLFQGGLAGMTGPAAVSDLVAGRAWPPAAEPCVEVAAFPCERMAEGRADEVAWIARRIVELEGRLRIAAPTAADPLAVRTATWGDFAVLLRATTHIKALEAALVAADVPYTVVKGLGFFHAREVVDVALLLGCVDQPRDDLAFAAVLRGPACGVSDDALFSLAACRAARPAAGEAPAGPATLVDVVEGWAAGNVAVAELSDGDAAHLRRFADTFADLRRRRGAGGVAALVERMFERTRIDVLALGRPNGRQRAANLRKVRVLARSADADGLSLGEFVAGLRDLREREVREAEATVAGGTQGAVSLMTVHASKGLEFPVVFVPDVGRTDTVRPGSIVSSPRDGVGLRAPSDVDTDAKPWAFERLTEARKAAERAEADRLLYVAVTRASDHLVLTGAVSGDWTKADPAKENRVWWRRIFDAFAIGGPALRTADLDVGPGADEARVTRAVVRVHAVGATGEAPGTGAPKASRSRTLLGRAAASGELATGVVRPLELRSEARAEAARLLTEAERVAPPPDGTPYATNVSALTAFERCPQEYRLRHVVGVPEDDAASSGARTAFDVDEPVPGDAVRPGDDEPDVEPSSRAFGRAAHAALERLVPGFDGDVRREAESALLAETDGVAPAPADVEKLVLWIERFRDSELGAEVGRASRAAVRREQAFLLRAGRTVVRGQIDLLWRADDGWVVVDWKTGELAEARREHELQMRLYALGVRAVAGALPSRSLLWSLPRGAAVAVACGPGDVAATERLLAEFSRRAAASDWSPPPAPPCGDCRVRAACAFASARSSA